MTVEPEAWLFVGVYAVPSTPDLAGYGALGLASRCRTPNAGYGLAPSGLRVRKRPYYGRSADRQLCSSVLYVENSLASFGNPA